MNEALDTRGRKIGGRAGNGGNVLKTWCHIGHSMADSYNYDGHRICRGCSRLRSRERYAKRKAKK